jgi:hypothetical protein
MDGGVRVETEAVRRRDAPCGALRQVEWQRRLKGAQLRALEVVVREGDVDVLEVLAGEAQHAVEDGGGIGVGGQRQGHLGAVDAPEGLGKEEVEVRRQLLRATIIGKNPLQFGLWRPACGAQDMSRSPTVRHVGE